MSYLQSLSVFIAVAEEENFTAAAKKLNLTQPTISFHMDNLEKQFGCPLFIRTSKGVMLTPYGRRLYESAGFIDKILKNTYSEIRSMVEGNAGHIHIGASTIPGEYILPSLISSFIKDHQSFRFTLTTLDSHSILERFHKGIFQIGIVGVKPEDDPAIELWDDELVLVGNPQFVSQIRNKDAADVLRTIPMVLRTAPSGSRATILQALNKLGVTFETLNIILEVAGNQGLKTAILDNAGIGFISEWAVKKELAAGTLKLVPVSGLNICRTFYLVSNPALLAAGPRLFIDYLINTKHMFIKEARKSDHENNTFNNESL